MRRKKWILHSPDVVDLSLALVLAEPSGRSIQRNSDQVRTKNRAIPVVAAHSEPNMPHSFPNLAAGIGAVINRKYADGFLIFGTSSLADSAFFFTAASLDL